MRCSLGAVAVAMLFSPIGFVLPAEAEPLQAGVAKVEVTPPEPAYMAGYGSRNKLSEGTFDPLHARVLVLDDGGKRLAIVAIDLLWFPSERVPREARERFGVGLTLLCASHTHSGPDYLHSKGWDDPARKDKLLRWTEDRVLDAIATATANLFPARLSVAQGDIALGYHRLVLQPNGRRTPLWRNPERIPIGPVDPRVAVIRVEDADAGTTRALLVNYACHPVCHGGSNYKFSTDYPGAMAAKVEETLAKGSEFSLQAGEGDGLKPALRTGTDGLKPALQTGPDGLKPALRTGSPICLFTQGGCGSVNPMFQGEKTDPPEDQKRAETMGGLLADEVLRALDRARPVSGPDEIQWRSRTQTFADRWSTTRTLEIGSATVMLNRAIGIMAIPGEPFLKHQMDFTRAAPVDFPLFFGYTNGVHAGWPEYIPDIRSAAEGGYGANQRTLIEVGGGERLVNQALVDLFDMKGMFVDTGGKW